MTVWGIMSGESLPITFERDDETGAEGRRPHTQQRGKAGYGHGWSSLAVSTQAHTPQSIWPQALPSSHTRCLRLGQLALPSNPSWGPVVQRPLYTLSCRVWASCPYNLLLLFPSIILCAFLSPCDHVSKELFFFFWDFFSSELYIQHGAPTHNPEMKNYMRYWFRQQAPLYRTLSSVSLPSTGFAFSKRCSEDC